ncbi:ArsC family reductase [Endozoicomonas sp. SM1973]|uniref:ArsC family reductase n=1 Tax=Spartinivicinus marinus TaxID=2994442 RepID=A0A853I595_9GAMM|nr:ArsC family reductase [Spartinivicinus marinus]MCX4025457.1 ArsC family reductase [Spartinivicinus marinus]NYZ65314.1 ArsC family reductase [Spartinivicinus marinus]
MIKLYGIKNCDTVKKARKWLDEQQIAYEFHDFKTAGIHRDIIAQWLTQLDQDTLINKRGTTWRRIPETQKINLTDEKAITLMLANPSVIKRPVLDKDGNISVGFSPESYSEILL